MPRITRVYLKTALVYFVLAMLTGLLVSMSRVLSLPRLFAGLTPVYFHLLMVGWVTLLIMGTAYWMFPRFSRELPRGHAGLMWSAYALLNVGLILRILAEPMYTVAPGPMPWGVLLALAALAQWLGGLAFVANVWPRVKER